MLLTFGQFKTSAIKRSSGLCVDGDDFRDFTNDATRQLMTRGNWWGTVQPVQGCVYQGCITWPRQVAAVLAMNVRGFPTTPANRWYQFLQWDGSYSSWGCGIMGRNQSYKTMASDGNMPVFNPIPCGQDRFLRVYPGAREDVGKKITFYGVDGNGQSIRSERDDGTWSDGVVLTLALPYVQSAFMVRRVDRVFKAVTVGPARVYQVDENGVLYDMAYYEPTETSPDYIRTKIPMNMMNSCCNNMISALVKLAFIPVVGDDDLVMIENEDALRDMILSIKYKEAGEIMKSRAFEQSAFRELNYEMRNRFPDNQVRITFRPFGEDSLQRVQAGMM